MNKKRLLGLIGGLLSAPISFGFPVLFYLGALARVDDIGHNRISGGFGVGSVSNSVRSFGVGSDMDGNSGGGGGGEVAGVAKRSIFNSSTSSSLLSFDENATWCGWLRSVIDSQMRGYALITSREKILFLMLLVLVLIAMIMGTIDNISQIVTKMGTYGKPYDCHLLNLTTRIG